ncbi:leucine-rich repeat protein [uncultured Ruminococcus sp.]|uniref:leucine-rich repeat protein n=1 Tax=uncultured Ruminococcus sp. TaxID=165186 RepID=UPI0025CCE937|nr:leucine-rich repeat protein [uncultured Ruminococcus sp.]
MNLKTIIAAALSFAVLGGAVQITYCFSPKSIMSVKAAETIYQGLKYETSNGEICITGHTADLPSNVEIPAEIGGIPVTSIGESAFEECNDLTGITITSSIKSIGDWAFYKCKSLTSITIPKSVTSIGCDAFVGTPWLAAKREEKPFVVINNILIDGKACSGDVTIPDGVTSICYYAFEDCGILSKITIPESVTNIDEGAFSYCSNLTSVTIPESVKSIGPSVFYECHKLTDITIPKSWTSIAYQTFEGCYNLTEITIPDSVTSIGGQAFMNCKSLTKITIPDSVTSIGADAFSATPWLEAKQKENPLVVVNNILVDGKACSGDVTIPDGVTSISDEAFKECTDLISITIPDSVKSIGDWAFLGCKNLIIKGKTGSYAETFAKEHHISFELLEKAPAVSTTTTKPVTSTTRVTTSVTTGTAKPVESKSGDVNNDGKVNAVDASTVLTYYANISTNKDGGFTESQKKAADLDNNGDINAVDASYILSYYAYTSITKEEIIPIEEYMKKK